MSLKQNQEYIEKRVNPIFESILIELLTHKPDDVVGYMQKWLQEKGFQFQQVAAEAQPHQTLDQLKKSYKSKKNEEHPSSESEGSDNEEVDDLPLEIIQKKGKERTSVSAEAFGTHNKKEQFKPKIIQKTSEQKEKIQRRILQSFMFTALDEKERSIIIDAMEEIKFKAGDKIIKQGDDGDVLYILESGEAECYRQFSKDAKEIFLKNYLPGDSFGELALLYNCPRAATIIAKTSCVTWALDR